MLFNRARSGLRGIRFMTTLFERFFKRSGASAHHTSTIPASPLTFSVLLAAAGIALLVLPEIWIALAALIWAATGLLHLPRSAETLLWISVLPIGLWASWRILRLALESASTPEDGSAAG